MPRTVHHRVDLLFTIAGIRTVAELAKQYDVHPTQVTAWKNELLQRATEMFDGMAAEGAADPEKVRELHAKIGELTVERDFFSACARSNLRSTHSWHSDAYGFVPATRLLGTGNAAYTPIINCADRANT